eukprot:gene34-164_t
MLTQRAHHAAAAGPALRTGRRRSVIMCVAVPTKPPTSSSAKRSKVEIIKEKSDYLRHPLMEELVDDKTYIGEESMQLMKFHG